MRLGEGVAGVAGGLLLASLFLPWFGGDGASFNAWESFRVVDLILAIAGMSGVTLAVLALTQSKTDMPVAGAALTVLVGIVALALAAYRELDPVGDLERRVGLTLGLLAALGITAGAWLAMRAER